MRTVPKIERNFYGTVPGNLNRKWNNFRDIGTSRFGKFASNYNAANSFDIRAYYQRSAFLNY